MNLIRSSFAVPGPLTRCAPAVRREALGWLLAALAALATLAGCAVLTPQVVYETPSMFGPLVVTEDGGGLRSMRFGRTGITQSTIKVGEPEYLRFDYLRLALIGMALLPPQTGAPRRVLLVGLGGGALPVFLHRHYPALQIDVVEIVPEVVTAAERYFGFRQDARMRAQVGDGRRFIERAEPAHYDIIILDAFGSAEVPAHLTTQEFLQAVRRALNINGVVVSNVWNARYNSKYDAMLRTYQEVFPEVHVIDTSREVNSMLFSLPQAASLGYDQFFALARQHTVQQRYPFDLGELVERGYLPAPRRNDAPVLRDAAPLK